MKLTLQIQLLPDRKQADQLKSTMERFNRACSWLAERAFEIKTANKISLQQRFYYELRQEFGLSAQMASICIRHVGGTYSRDKSVLPTFRSNAAMPYDSRILSFKSVDQVSILTLEGRIIVPLVMGKWSFAELRGFIEYKAKLAGGPVIPVDPRNTSRTCPKCGHIDKGSRTARGLFLCRSCGHFDHADIVGATNIASAAKVAWREVAEQRLTAVA
ncbi:MAG TPA: zinc ribbon domain-containing protein [Blastocatellia bacterium]|nr:zinc ribbon domain-containing protein [Blastocatellia bacterium]